MDSIIAIFKEILKHGKETNTSRTVFFTIMVIILLLNSYLIDNLSIKQFPNSILAGMFGFDTATYFEASESSKDVPNVSFE